MNKNKQIVQVKIIILFLLLGVFYYQIYSNYTILQRNYYCISARLQDKAVTKKQLADALDNMVETGETHIPELTAYCMEENTAVFEPILERTTYATLYRVYGVMKQVTPSEIAAGNFVSNEDYAGCVMDEDSAFALFGNEKPLEQIVRINDKSYYVRGIIKSETPIIMIEDPSEETQYWNLELNYGTYLQGREYATRLINNYGLSSKYVIIEQNFIADCIGNLLVLPVLILFLVILVSQVRKIRRTAKIQYQELHQRAYRMRKDWLRFIGHLTVTSMGPLLLIAGSLALFLVTWNKFGLFPMRYFPSKWSDFDQYVSFYNQIKEHLGDLSYVNPTRREVLFKQYCMRCLFLSVSTLFLEWHIMDLVMGLLKKKDEAK